MIRVKKVVGLLPQRRTQKLPVQFLDIWVFVGKADGSIGVQLPKAAAPLRCQFHPFMDRLSTAAGAATRTSHNLYKVVANPPLLQSLHQPSGIA